MADKMPKKDPLEDTFPASDPVPLKPPERDTPVADEDRIPKVKIGDEAMPPEKPM